MKHIAAEVGLFLAQVFGGSWVGVQLGAAVAVLSTVVAAIFGLRGSDAIQSFGMLQSRIGEPLLAFAIPTGCMFGAWAIGQSVRPRGKFWAALLGAVIGTTSLALFYGPFFMSSTLGFAILVPSWLPVAGGTCVTRGIAIRTFLGLHMMGSSLEFALGMANAPWQSNN